MIRPWRRLASWFAVPVLFATACNAGSDEAPLDEATDEIDYRSTAGQECPALVG